MLWLAKTKEAMHHPMYSGSSKLPAKNNNPKREGAKAGGLLTSENRGHENPHSPQDFHPLLCNILSVGHVISIHYRASVLAIPPAVCWLSVF